MENNIFTPLKGSRIKVSWKKYLSRYYLWYYGKKIKNISFLTLTEKKFGNDIHVFHTSLYL